MVWTSQKVFILAFVAIMITLNSLIIGAMIKNKHQIPRSLYLINLISWIIVLIAFIFIGVFVIFFGLNS